MIRVGIIGTGSQANSHARAWAGIKGATVCCCCDLIEQRAREFAAKYGIPRWYTDYREMLAVENLDAVDNVTSDDAHALISLAAIARGLPVLCEKPLATTLGDAKKMRDAAAKRGLVTQVNFSYRNASGAQAAAAYIAGGGIGRILHVESSYLQSWLVQPSWGDWRTKTAFTWRLSTRHGSTGVLGDIGCHIYDLTTFLCGDIAEISCTFATFDKGIKGNRLGPYILDANDSFVSTVKFSNGALGTIHATRWATGQKNSLRVRVYGDQGAVEVDLDKGYDLYRVVKGKKAIQEAEWKEVRSARTPSQIQRFFKGVRTGESDVCDFSTGARIQAYLHYSFASDAERRPVKVRI